MKKKLFSLILLIILINIISIAAINLEVSSKPVSNSFVVELEDPAIFDLTIKNLESEDSFKIYSLVGMNITHVPFRIGNEETQKVRIYLTPQDYLKSNPKPYTFEYKIKNSKKEIQSETLTINILKLGDVFSVISEPINPKSEKISLTIKNNIMKNFKDVNFKMSSEFFKHEEKFSFVPNDKKYIEIEIDKNKIKSFSAGNYILNSEISMGDDLVNVESQIKFLETEGIEISENKEGSIIQRTEITKKNTGNVRQLVSIREKKNVISYLFTTTNIVPTKTETNGVFKTYTWEKVLIPNEELKVVIKTNWLFPIFIILILIAGIKLIRKSIYDNLELTKKVSFVKTKGGEFALKISVKAKAKKQIEKIRIVDKFPQMVKLYNKFGMINPDKIDLESRKLYWNINKLNKGETRIFTYIVYSKIGVLGKVELPEAEAFYEDDGKTKQSSSNRSFYVRDSL